MIKKIRNINPRIFIRKIFLVFLASLLTFTPVSALSPAQHDMFADNNILFYDPDSQGDNCYRGNGAISIQGGTAAEKVWSGLLSVGFNEIETAGIMGNMAHEGNYFNPAQHESALRSKYWDTNEPAARNADGTFNLGANGDHPEDRANGKYYISYGLGLIQWSFGRRSNMYEYTSQHQPDLLQYYNNPNTYSYANGSGYGVNGDKFIELAGENVMNALLEIQIVYLWEEVNNTEKYKGVIGQPTVAAAAEYFLRKVEIPADPDGSLAKRVQTAEEFYEQFAGNYTYSDSNAASYENGANVTIVGDSLTDGSRTELLSKFTEMNETQIDADVGRQLSVGIEILKSATLRDVVVFALGTNSAGTTQSQIDEVIEIVGESRRLIFLTNYGVYDYTSNNELFEKAAQDYSNVSIGDWAGSVSADPDRFIGPDGYHPTPEGNELFASIIYDAVNKNAASNGCGVSGSFVETVLAYAWPEYHSAQYLERMPAYAATVTDRVSNGIWVGGSVRGVPGIDCGGFVTILVQDSGYEPLYNTGPGGVGIAGNVTGQEPWVEANGWTLLNSSYTTQVDTSILQPGDVAFSGGVKPGEGGHTFIYVGEIAGFNSVIASASYSTDGTGGRSPMAGSEELDYSGYYKSVVRWYRKGS